MVTSKIICNRVYFSKGKKVIGSILIDTFKNTDITRLVSRALTILPYADIRNLEEARSAIKAAYASLVESGILSA